MKLARHYDVSPTVIASIHLGKTWKDAQQPKGSN
jgi:hypothetical protein